MASPPHIQPLNLEAAASLAQNAGQIQVQLPSAGQHPPLATAVSTPSPTALSVTSPEGIDCYGNERQALTDQAKFFNNPLLSDVILIVGGNRYFAHKLILVRSSDVFERMLSDQWKDSQEKEIELVEDSICVSMFPRFLTFLYSCHIRLNMESTLPVLVLADKYNVKDLQEVCINFACSCIIPKLQLKDVFHVWFQYATKCYHQRLISSCVTALSEKMDDIIVSVEWEREWGHLDKEQLIEFLKSSSLCIKDEFELWNATLKWLNSSQHPKRLSQCLKIVVEHIRFPMMTPEQLTEMENLDIVLKNKNLFQKHFMTAYKYHALPLTQRALVKEFHGPCFLLRNYTDLRWDKRFVIPMFSAIPRGAEVSFRFTTRSSTFPPQTWEWELKVYPKGYSSTAEDFRCVIYSNLILDQPRPVEYLLSVVSKSELIHTVSGKKNFSKTRYTADTEMDKKITVVELNELNSPLLVDNTLVLQITLKPVE